MQQVHITTLITKKIMGVTDLLFELQLIENSHAQAAGVRENSENNEKLVCTCAKNIYKFLIFGECKVQKRMLKLKSLHGVTVLVF